MNIFVRELLSRRKGQIGWVVSMIVFMVLSVVKFNTLSLDTSASSTLLKQFPPTIQAVFGMTGLDLSTLSGYYGVLFIYLLVILAIHAGMLGSSVLADEERDRTTEFLLVKPVSRKKIVTNKLLAGLVYIVVMWLVVMLSTWIATLTLTNVGDFMRDFWNFMCALGVVQLLFYALGACAAASIKNSKLPARAIAAVVCASYLIFALTKLSTNLAILKAFSVFCYFDAVQIIGDGRLQLVPLIVCIIFTALLTGGTYVFYTRRDVNV